MKQFSGIADVVLSLGANVGDRLSQLLAAREHLAATDSVSVERESTIYETPPLGVGPQHEPYLNQVLVLRVTGSAADFMARCKEIETTMGRPAIRHKILPRLIDLDIVTFGDLRSDDPRLILPHPRYTQRLFVLQPLKEVLPSFRDPATGRTIDALLADCPDTSTVVPLTADEVGV